MSVTVRSATDDDLDRWDDLVRRSPHGTPFHRTGAMDVLAEHSNTSLHPLIGVVGQEPVGLLPMYEKQIGPFSVAFSPPPNLKVNAQGPLLLNFEKLKTRKATQRHGSFIDRCRNYLDDKINPRYLLVRTPNRYEDPRPLLWNEFSVEPRYTYVVDISSDRETLLSSFSSDARQNVTAEYDRDIDIHEAGDSAIERIVSQLQARHAEQNETYRVTSAFVEDLRRTLPDGTVRPYECVVDGEFAGGMIALEHGDTMYRWQGGAKTDLGVPINDLVDWYIIRDAMERGLSRYDLVGANLRRLANYKAKFAPELEPYFEAVRSDLPMRALAAIYRRLR